MDTSHLIKTFLWFNKEQKVSMAIDFAWVLLFVAVGRHNHENGIRLNGILSTLWPFAVGLIVGWFFLKVTRRKVVARISGSYLVLLVVAIGMLLRVISGQGITGSFVLVATTFLSIFLIGWREIYNRVSRR